MELYNTKMFSASFNVRVATAIKDRPCCICWKKIKENDIKIEIYHLKGSENYHLDCYTPKIKQYICKRNIKIYLKGDYAAKFNRWLDNWNKNYVPIDKPYHSPPKLIKRVESKPSTNRRVWIGVFMFISPIEVSKSLSFICKEFYHITWDEELWHFYYTNEFQAAQNDQATSWRNKYISMTLQACIGCHRILTGKNFFRCPMLKKPLCWHCRENTHKYKLMSKADISLKYGVNANLLNLQFYEGSYIAKVTYGFMVKKAVAEYRALNKARLLKNFENYPDYHELKEIVDSINISKIHKKEIFPDEKLIANPFYHCFDKILQYIRNKKGGFKGIKSLNN